MQHRTILSALLFTVALVSGPAPATAQSIGDFVAYGALVTTPVGGLPSAPLAGGNSLTRAGVDGRFSYLPGIGGSPGVSHIAASYARPAGRGLASATGGVALCDGCKGNYMLGVDWLAPIAGREWKVGFRPALGIAKSTEDGSGTIWAGALSFPVSWVNPGSTGIRVVPFVEPGIGFGGIAAPGVSESGNRMMVSGGLFITDDTKPVSMIVSARKVILKGSKLVYGIGLNLSGGGR